MAVVEEGAEQVEAGDQDRARKDGGKIPADRLVLSLSLNAKTWAMVPLTWAAERELGLQALALLVLMLGLLVSSSP